MKVFRKRVLTIKSCINQSFAIFNSFNLLKKAFKRKAVDSSFRERIMLSVTQVNQCRFCSFGHTQAALANGISNKEISEILQANFANVPDNQKTALLFAQYYAEKNGAVESVYFNQMSEYYGPETALDILVFVRFIAFCNLCGNTIDAFFQRFTKTRILDSNFFHEIVVFFFIITILPTIFVLGLIYK